MDSVCFYALGVGLSIVTGAVNGIRVLPKVGFYALGVGLSIVTANIQGVGGQARVSMPSVSG